MDFPPPISLGGSARGDGFSGKEAIQINGDDDFSDEEGIQINAQDPSRCIDTHRTSVLV